MSVLRVWTAAVAAVLLIGVVDYASGAELRVFPLYFAPVSLVAWYHGRAGALLAAVLCSISWLTSNLLTGLMFWTTGLWVANTIVQGISFATVGLLIATLRAALSREQDLGRTDSVTSVSNSRAFYDEAGRLLALCRRKRRPVTVAYVDLDHFKDVNDRLGHSAGDELLRSVAVLLQTSIRPSDALARLGGDEFALLLPESGPEEAAATLERLRLLIVDTLASSQPPVTATFGAVTFLTAPDTVEEMVQAADSRMYAAKNAGRNRVHLEVVPGAGDVRRVSPAALR